MVFILCSDRVLALFNSRHTWPNQTWTLTWVDNYRRIASLTIKAQIDPIILSFMKEALPTETIENGHPMAEQHFKELQESISDELRETRQKGDLNRIPELESKKQEIDNIVQSLEGGDTEPAKKNLIAMIEQNIKFIKLGVPNDLVDETHEARIQRLVGVLADLEGEKSAREPERMSEKESVKPNSTAETPEAIESEATMREVKVTEQRLRELFTEIGQLTGRLQSLLDKMKLLQFKSEILH